MATGEIFSEPVCERCIVWAKLNLSSDVKIPVPLPESTLLSITDSQFKQETAKVYESLETKNFGQETLEASVAIIQRLATWKVSSEDIESIFEGRESKFLNTYDDFYMLCVYLLYRSHDTYYGSTMSPLSRHEIDTLMLPSPFAGVPFDMVAEKKYLCGEDGDIWGSPNSQEELDNYLQNCQDVDAEVSSPMASELARRKKVMSQCREQDHFDYHCATDNSTDDGSVSPMGKAMKYRNERDIAHQEEDYVSDASPMSSKLSQRKRQMAHPIATTEEPDFFFLKETAPTSDGLPSPMSAAMHTKVRGNLDEKFGGVMYAPTSQE